MKARRAVAGVAVAAALVVPLVAGGGATGQATKQAVVVVQHGDLGIASECVGFDEASIDGIELVDRTAFDYLTASFTFGPAMCWLDGEGCETTDPDECFCDPVSSWSYWVQDGDGLPMPAEVGAGDREVVDGSVDYWVWGPFGEPPIQPTSTDAVCGESSGGGPDGSSPQPAPDLQGGTGVEGVRVPLPATR